MSFEKLPSQMRLLLSLSLLVVVVHSHWVDDRLSAVIQSQNDDVWGTIQKIREFSFPNLKGCEQTKACFLDLLTSIGFDSDSFPSYDDYLNTMKTSYATGQALKNYCGTFDAVTQCFSQESDSCRTKTVFASIFDITEDEASRFVSDLDLRKIMCDNQQAVNDPCMKKMAAVQSSLPVENDADASCDVVAADFSAVISKADCPDSVATVSCQINSKTKEIETIGACDGKIPKCPTNFHSCDRMQACFDQFYDGVEKAGVKSPLPNYPDYAKNMKNKFENANGIDDMCRLQTSLHACLLRHINKNCPLNPASFRSMYNMNYEQAYAYSTDFNLRKEQCLNKEGVKQNSCVKKARNMDMCTSSIPHNLTLGRACTDLRLSMKCQNFEVRQHCEPEARKMYCITQGIIYQQEALGFCDGWMPDCDDVETTAAPLPTGESPQSTTLESVGDILAKLQNLTNLSLPNFAGCEQTRKCFLDLLTSIGFDSDSFPSYDDYLNNMKKNYATGQALKNYCGTFSAVTQCFSKELDSCRTPTVFAPLFGLNPDDAYRFASDLDLRKIMCDNQKEVNDPCMKKMAAVQSIIPVDSKAAVSCDVVAADFSAVINMAAETGCPDSVASVSCQINTKTKEIETVGQCDGKIPKCPTNFHSCDRMQSCFEQFYGLVEQVGVKSPLPNYADYAKNMKSKFENPNGIDCMCRLQSGLHSCLLRHVNKNCPINAASFRKMFNLNYEQAYSYSTDFNLRKQQCVNKEGVKKNTCLALAKPLMNVCEPSIPHNLTLGESCTDLRLAMKCNNFAVRQSCSDETLRMYCITQGIIYQQEALGFCDGWMPDCDDLPYPTSPTAAPLNTPSNPITCPAWTNPTTTTSTTKGSTTASRRTTPPPATTGPTPSERTPPPTTTGPTTSTQTTEVSSTVTSPAPTTPTTSLSFLPISIMSTLLVILRLTL